MGDTRGREWKAVQQRREGLPREAPLTPPKQRAEPDASYMEVKCLERLEVAREAKVGVMPPQHLTQPPMLIAHRLMSPTLRFFVQRRELRRHALPLCLPLHHKASVPSPPTVVSETQEGERTWAPLAPLFSSQCRKPAKLEHTGLLFVELKLELR